MGSTFTISDLAREFDLTTRAIRFYEDMGLLQPERSGPGGRNRVYSLRDRTRLKLTLRAKRLGLSLTEAKELIDMYDSPRDTGPQLRKFLEVLALHRRELEEQLAEIEANLDEVRVHEKEARALLVRTEKTAEPAATPARSGVRAATRPLAARAKKSAGSDSAAAAAAAVVATTDAAA
jgi:DNA-binding transcriptional MerR regulator